MCVGVSNVVVRPFVLLFVLVRFCPAILRVSFDPRNCRLVSPLVEVGTHRRPEVCVCGHRGSKALTDVLAFFFTIPSLSSLWWILPTHSASRMVLRHRIVLRSSTRSLERVCVPGYSLCEYARKHPFKCQAPDPAVPESFTYPLEYDRTVSRLSSFSTHFPHVPLESVRSFAVPPGCTMRSCVSGLDESSL